MAFRIDLHAKATISASGQGGAKAVAGVKELLVLVDVTDLVTTPTLTVYLQSSSDGGTTWFDVPHRGAKLLTATAAEPAAEIEGDRNIVDATTAVAKWAARYTEFGDLVRLAFIFSGAGSFDLAAKAIGK